MPSAPFTPVTIDAQGVFLPGDLRQPEGANGLVVFAHGSGSGRKSSRNQYVASILFAGDFASLLFDLLTPEEDPDYAKRFDIPLLADRLQAAAEWSRDLNVSPIGLFGASTGAAAALIVAARLDPHVTAVVSRGGRPDLAWEHLPEVRCPTLFIVGARDEHVLDLNRQAFARLPTSTAKELSVVSGATHLFEEPGKLEEAAGLARDWFQAHLVRPAPATGGA